MPQPANKNFPEIRLYNGYGNGRHMVLFGHILTRTIKPKNRYTANMLHNGLDMLKLFLVKPFSNVRVRLTWHHVVLETYTGKDGFFSCDWQAETELPEGWHAVEVATLTPTGSVVNETKGEFFVPEKNTKEVK